MFNIITPTFNRESSLHRVYESLLNQTYKRFHWIIIDDCSTDNTNNLVQKWINEGEISIEYYFLSQNKGKSCAVNFGLQYCSMPYTIIADSDDKFEPYTLSDLLKLWLGIEICSDKNKIGAIWTLTKNEKGKLVGDLFPKDLWQVGFKERVLKNNIKGEKWACWRTDIIKHVTMYYEVGLNIQESQTWNRINRNHDFLCVNVTHRIYYYSEDGIMAAKYNKMKQSKLKYYNSYYGLKDISIKDIMSYSFYYNLAFEHISAHLFFSDKTKKLSFEKKIILCIISFLMIPRRLFYYLSVKH